MYEGRLDLARELVQESDEIHGRTGDVWGRAQTIGTLGAITRDEGDEQRAIPLVEQSAALALEAGVPWWQGGMLAEFAALSLNAGRIDEAERRARESLATADLLRDHVSRIFCVGILASIAPPSEATASKQGGLWAVVEEETGRWRRSGAGYAIAQRAEERGLLEGGRPGGSRPRLRRGSQAESRRRGLAGPGRRLVSRS